MARPPRERIPGMNGPGDEAGADELPLELPRVDPVRPRLPRPETRAMPRVEPKFESDRDEQPASRFAAPLRPALRASDPPDVEPERERLRNPFDYYAMPADEGDPLSRPITKAAPAASSEFLTSKYYTPRSELTASRKLDGAADQTDSWASSVRPGRSILDLPRERDEAPDHLRHLPSRVRDHLRAEPRMPSVSEPLNSFAKPAAQTPQDNSLWARSTVPLPLAPELRSPVPQDIRVTRQTPEMPQISRRMEWPDERAETPLSPEPEFDEQSDEAITDYDPVMPPIVVDAETRDQAFNAQAPLNDDPASLQEEDDDDNFDDTYDDDDYDDDEPDDRSDEVVLANDDDRLTQSGAPSWMRRTESVVPPVMATTDWDQDQAMHALTSRLRNRANETRDRYNRPRGEVLGKMRNALGIVGGKVRDKTDAIAKVGSSVQQIVQAKVQEKVQARAVQQSAKQAQARDEDLRATPNTAVEYQAPAPELDYSTADHTAFMPREKRRKFWQRRPNAPVRVSPELHRASRRHRQSRLYEDIVAWVVVPPFIIGAIYGGLELAKFLSNSPLGKMLSGQ